MTSPVIAVIGHDSHQAQLARDLIRAARRAPVAIELRTHRELVREVTIEQGAGQAPVICPDRPLMWLATGDRTFGSSPDDRFLYAETAAAARAIGLLTRAPVLNRPTEVSAVGRLPMSSAAAVRGVAGRLAPGMVRPECFSSSVPVDAADGDWEIQDYSTGANSYRPVAAAAGPFRFRPARPDARLVVVGVVAGRVLAQSVPAAVIAASLSAAAAYDLEVAMLWWLLDAADRPTLARIDASLGDSAEGPDTTSISDALVAWAVRQSDPRAEAR